MVSGLNDIQYNVTVVVLNYFDNLLKTVPFILSLRVLIFKIILYGCIKVLTSTDTGKNSKKLVKKLRENCKMIQKVRYNPGHGITITGDYCIDLLATKRSSYMLAKTELT